MQDIDGQPEASAAESASGRLSVWQYCFGAGVLLTGAFLGYQMLQGPVHGVADAAACTRAYADARTASDTGSVDSMSYPDSAGRRRLCGLLNPKPVADLGR